MVKKNPTIAFDQTFFLAFFAKKKEFFEKTVTLLK